MKQIFVPMKAAQQIFVVLFCLVKTKQIRTNKYYNRGEGDMQEVPVKRALLACPEHDQTNTRKARVCYTCYDSTLFELIASSCV